MTKVGLYAIGKSTTLESNKSLRTLIITTSKQRIQHLREATSNYPFRDSRAKRFLWATPQEQATEDWIFEAIWRSMDRHDQTLYRIG